MKMKSFAMLALSGLLAASIVYTAPAMADDQNMNDQSTQQSATDNMNTGSTQHNDNMNNNDSNSDQGVADTATGDDDY